MQLDLRGPQPTAMYARAGAVIVCKVFPHPKAVPNDGRWFDSPDRVPAIGEGRIISQGGETLTGPGKRKG
jgi:hypothetical protein